MVDANLSWTDRINILEDKLSKNLGSLHKTKKYLNRKAMTSLYFSFLHSYRTYGNIARCSTSVSKLKKFASKQKQAVKTVLVITSDAGFKSQSQEIARNYDEAKNTKYI